MRKKKLLTKTEMEKLNTKRLLSYRTSLLEVHEHPNNCWESHHGLAGELTKESPEWKETYKICKEILATREHVEKSTKSSPKKSRLRP